MVLAKSWDLLVRSVGFGVGSCVYSIENLGVSQKISLEFVVRIPRIHLYPLFLPRV